MHTLSRQFSLFVQFPSNAPEAGNSLMKGQEVAIWKWSESKENVPGCTRGLRELTGLLGFPGSIEGALQHEYCSA